MIFRARNSATRPRRGLIGGLSMTARRVVIVGGGGGGDAAAFALRKRGFDGEITIISADLDRPYDRPYLSKEFLRGEVDLQKVFLHDEAEYSKERIELRLQERVVGGSLQDRRLSLQSGREVGFDTLVVSTGGTPRRLPDAPDSDNVLTLRSLRDRKAVRDALSRGQRPLLVGAGFNGARVGAYAPASIAPATLPCTRIRCWSRRFASSTGRWPSITAAASRPRLRPVTRR